VTEVLLVDAVEFLDDHHEEFVAAVERERRGAGAIVVLKEVRLLVVGADRDVGCLVLCPESDRRTRSG
jgi:hypothetical protein